MSGIFAILRSTLCHVQWKVLGLFFTTKKVCELKFTAEVHDTFFDLSKWQMNYIGWKRVSFFCNLFYFLPFFVFFNVHCTFSGFLMLSFILSTICAVQSDFLVGQGAAVSIWAGGWLMCASWPNNVCRVIAAACRLLQWIGILQQVFFLMETLT